MFNDVLISAYQAAKANNHVRMVLKPWNDIVKVYVYRHFPYDGRDVYSALVYPDGTIVYGPLLAERGYPTQIKEKSNV